MRRVLRNSKRPVTDILARQAGRGLLWLPPCMIFGIGFYFALPTEPPGYMPAIMLLGASLFGGAGSWLRRAVRPFPSGILFALAMLVLGFAMAHFQTLRVQAPVLASELEFTDLKGTVRNVAPLPGGGVRLRLDNLEIEELEPGDTPQSVRLTLRGSVAADPPSSGTRIKTLAQLRPPPAPSMPGGFDVQRWAFYQGIGAFGFAYRPPETLEPSEAGPVAKARDKITRAALDHAGPVAAALLTGARSGIPEDDLKALRAAGLAHLLAISGLHIGLMAGVVFFALRLGLAAVPPLALHYPIRKWAAAGAMLAAILYTALAGAPIPTQRAALMTTVVLFAVMLDRQAITLRLVALAALAVMLMSPESVLGPSFQMSFAAVTGLVAFYEFWRERRRRQEYVRRGGVERLGIYFLGILITSVIAVIATAPFTLMHFDKIAPYGIVANLVAIPLMAFCVMPLGLISLLAVPVGLEGGPMQAMQWGIKRILDMAHWVESWPGSLWRWPDIGVFWPTLAALCLLFAALWRGPARLAGLGLAPLALVAGWVFWTPPLGLVTERGTLFVRDPATGQFYGSDFRRDRYAREEFLAALGRDPETRMLKLADHGRGSCDARGCVWTMAERDWALSRDPRSHREDCARADILMAVDPVFQKCAAPDTVIDRFFLYRNGATMFWYMNSRLWTVTVRESRPDRPWVR